jgi:hypothetical protein
MTKKKKWFLGIGGGILLLLAWIVVLSPWVWPGPGIDSLIISKETTWLTDPPMKPNGMVNYVQYAVDHSTEGVTPENNAFACFMRALGPKLIEDWADSDCLDQELVQLYVGASLDEWEGPFLGDVEKVLEESIPADELHEYHVIDTSDIEKRLTESPWAAAEYPKMKQWLDENATPLEWIVKGSQRERYSYWSLFRSDKPNDDYLLNSPMLDFDGLRGAARALAIRAMYKMGSGDIEGAWADTMAIRRMARLISQDAGLTSQIVCYAIDSPGLEAQQLILRSKTFPVTQARGMLKELQSLPTLPLLVGAMEMELLGTLDSVMRVAATPVNTQAEAMSGDDSMETKLSQSAGRILDINHMLRTFNTAWKPLVDQASKPTMSKRKVSEMLDFPASGKNLSRTLTASRIMKLLLGGPSTRRRVTTDIMSDLLMYILYPSLNRACTLRDTAETKAMLTETMAAMAVYRAEKGNWPAELGDLVPAILPAVPADPWSKENAPLLYNPTPDGFLLYSLGYNETDDGGESNGEIEEGDVLISDPKREEDD